MLKTSVKTIEAGIMDALRGVKNPHSGVDVVSAGALSGLQVNAAGEVFFALEVDPQQGAALEPLRIQAENAAKSVKGVSRVTVVLTAEKPTDQQSPARTPSAKVMNDPHGLSKNPPLKLPIRKIIAVASGKGGVGKSTVAANLAVFLAKNSQKRVGLLDADIYGPSQPRMMGVAGQKPDGTSGQIKPLQAHGLKIMSIGLMVEEEKALVWRGPMVQSALYQMLRDVEWGTEAEPLDILVIDMPPGTGDAQLTIAQKVPLAGAVIVSTPQDIALIDARKGVQMFKTVGVPILGVIENMSTHICSNCGHEDHIFGHGGAKEEAVRMGVPFLGEIPLHATIRAQGDAGAPIAASAPGGTQAKAFETIAQKVIAELDKT